MRTILKAFGIAAAAVAALLAVGALLLWLLFDPNDYRDELEAMVEDSTGREFSIDGDLGLTFFPWLGVEIGPLRLGQAAGFGEDDFASVESAVARVRLLPLLRGRTEIDTVVLAGLELNLARDAEGRDNWSDLLGPAPAGGVGVPPGGTGTPPGVAEAPDGDAGSTDGNDDSPGGNAGASPGDAGTPTDADERPRLPEFGIAGVEVRDGVVFWKENIDEVRFVVSDISLQTGPIVPGAPVDVNLGLRWVGVNPAFTAQVDGQAVLAADPGTPGFRADGLRLEFRVEDGRSVERIVGDLETTATLDSAARALRLDDLRIDSDLTGFSRGVETVNVTAIAPSVGVDLAAWTAEVPEAVSTLDGIVASWSATAEGLAGEPLLAGNVAIADASVEEALTLLGLEHDAPMGDFDLRSRFQAEPLAGRAALTGLELALLDATITGDLGVDATEVSGSLEAPAFAPGAFFGAVPSDWLDYASVAGVEQLALSADFTASRTDSAFSVRQFAVEIPGATVSGNVDRTGDGAGFNGRLLAADVNPEVLATVLPDLLPETPSPDQLGPLGIDTAFDYDATGSMLRLDDLDASALGLRAGGDFTVIDPAGSPGVTGTLRVANFSPRALLRRLGRDVPATADPGALAEATLSADVALASNGAEFTALAMRLDDTNVTGRVEVAGFDDPRYAFDLTMDRIDLDRYLRPDSGAQAASGEGGGEFDTTALADLNLSGRLSAAEMRVAGLSLTGFSTSIDLAEGVGRVEPLRTGLYGGEFRGGAEFDVRAGGPLVSLRGAMDGVDIQGLLTASSGEAAAISGTGTFDMELTGIGDDFQEVIGNATGSIGFALRDGALLGMNLDHLMCSLYNDLAGHPSPAPATVDATPYSLLQGTAQVRDGIAETADLVGNLTTVQARGGGRVDLVTYGLDIDLDAGMTAPIRIPGCETLDGLVGSSIPITVGGTIGDPRVRPDFAELVRQSLRQQVEEAVIDAVLDLFD